MMKPLSRTSYRPKPASAFPPFAITFVLYFIFAFWRITDMPPAVWVLIAFVAIPLAGGLIGRSAATTWRGVGWAMAFYTFVGLIKAGAGVRSGTLLGHMLAGTIALVVYSQLAGGIAALVAHLLTLRQRAPKKTP